LYLDEDIDGETLVLLQQEEILKIFPRIKDRVKFVDLRAKLIANSKEQHTDADEITGNLFESTLPSSASSQFLDTSQHNGLTASSILITNVGNQNGETFNDQSSNIDCNDPSSNVGCNDLSSNVDCADSDYLHVESRLPMDYIGPTLSTRMQHYVDENNLSKFNPHTTLRSELLSLLFDDVTNTHQLL
jgi:hypothetical protein